MHFGKQGIPAMNVFFSIIVVDIRNVELNLDFQNCFTKPFLS